jgi:hypothetical protein
MEKTDVRKAQELAFEELEAYARAKLLPDRIEMRHRRRHLSPRERRLARRFIRWALF